MSRNDFHDGSQLSNIYGMPGLPVSFAAPPLRHTNTKQLPRTGPSRSEMREQAQSGSVTGLGTHRHGRDGGGSSSGCPEGRRERPGLGQVFKPGRTSRLCALLKSYLFDPLCVLVCSSG